MDYIAITNDVECDDFSSLFTAIKGYYEKDGNSVGGNLHIALDDGNLEDESLSFCLNQALKENDLDGVKLCALMLNLSVLDRVEVYKSEERNQIINKEIK